MSDPARILIVDDEPYNLDLLEEELELLGHATVRASDGAEALACLEVEPVDLVLLDIMMPALDGDEVLRRMKRHPHLRRVPVVMVSAISEMGSVVRCIELGAEDYLPKPFDPVLLKARVGACLEKKRWQDQETAYLRRIEDQMQEIEAERRRADRLLHAILPAPAVAELKASDHVKPRRFEDVAVLFADVADFTPYCELHPPEDVVAQLNHLVETYERLADAHGLEKIKTVGDAFMATANLLTPHDDPVMASVRCAFAMIEAASSCPANWQLRVGIHCGPVVGGVVGRGKFSFDLWGDTVNVAARLSTIGSSGAIYLSGETWAQVATRCRAEALGLVPLKGKGEIEVYRCHACA